MTIPATTSTDESLGLAAAARYRRSFTGRGPEAHGALFWTRAASAQRLAVRASSSVSP